MMFTDQQVIAALRAWWQLEPSEYMPWEGKTENEHESKSVMRFRDASLRDMRAALDAANSK